MRMSEKVDKVLPKLLKVKAEMKAVSKSSDNPYFKSKYADLNSHVDVVEPLLQQNGLLLLQPVGSDERGDYVESVIIDAESGQLVASKMHLVLVKNDMQAVGSAVTYARRYTLGSLLTMKAEDDDGEGAVGRVSKAINAGVQNAMAAAGVSADRPTKKSSFRKAKEEAPTGVTKTEVKSEDGWE